MGLKRNWIRLIARLFPGVFRNWLDGRGFDMVITDSTLDLHRVAELKAGTADMTVKKAIADAALVATRFLNGGNPEYTGYPGQALFWANKTLAVCTDNPVFVPRAKNTTQEQRGAGKTADGVFSPDEFHALFGDEQDLDAIYARTLELFSLPPTFDTIAFWRSSGFRWIIANEFGRELEKQAKLGAQQIMAVDPFVGVAPSNAERQYKISRTNLKVSDAKNRGYAKLGAFGQRLMLRSSSVQIFEKGKKGRKLPPSTVGEGEQKILSYIDRRDKVHQSYLIVCRDNDVLYSLLMMMPSLINPETGLIEKEIWVDLSQQTTNNMRLGSFDATHFVNAVELWTKLMMHFHKYAPLVMNPIETFSFLACCTGSDFNDALEPTVRGLKTSEKVYWDVFSAITADCRSGYIDSSGDMSVFKINSASKELLSKLVTVTRCLHHPAECEHQISLQKTAFEVFYTACCSSSVETTRRSLEAQINKFQKKTAPKKSKPESDGTPFVFTIRDLNELVRYVDQMKTDADVLQSLATQNPHQLSEKVVQTAFNLVRRIKNIAISPERCEMRRINFEWTLNYMHRASTGMCVSMDTPLNISNSELRKLSASSKEELPPPPANYHSMLRDSKNWPWVVEAISMPSSHDYNNSYHQIESKVDASQALSTRIDFYSVKTKQALL